MCETTVVQILVSKGKVALGCVFKPKSKTKYIGRPHLICKKKLQY